MAIRVSRAAHIHRTDIDPTTQFNSREWDRIVNVCVTRAETALQLDHETYSKQQRYQIFDVISSMASTSRTIRRVLDGAESSEPESVDVFVLVRLQLEGLFSICLMLESPTYVDSYTRHHWKKRYSRYLLIREETKLLPRWQGSKQLDMVRWNLLQLRVLYGISDAQFATIEQDELGNQLPPGVSRQSIDPFPTPGQVLGKIAAGDKLRMLERLYLEYVELCSFAHGSPEANLQKIMYDKQSRYQSHISNAKRDERFQREVVGGAYILNFLSIVQSIAELTAIYPKEMALVEVAHRGWTQLSCASLLAKAIWEIRAKALLRII